MVKNLIVDGSGTKNTAKVTNDPDESNALVVATRELKTYNNDIKFFTNSSYGSNMNVNASFGGTPELIHDGIDTIAWTGTTITGTLVDFDNTEQNHTPVGASSVLVSVALNTVWQFAKGSDIDMTGYAALSLWVYVDRSWSAADSVEMYGWDVNTNTLVGTPVNLEDYFSYDDFDTWHSLVIPLTDFGNLSISTVLNAFRCRYASRSGRSVRFFMDDIELEETGNPVKYSLLADKGTWLHVVSLSVMLVGNVSSILADASMPNLSYDSLLGVTMTTGLTYKREQDEETLLTLQLRTLFDFLQLPGISITSLGSDGVNTFIKLDQVLTTPIILKPEKDDILSYTVNDDLSSFLQFRIVAGCKSEQRELGD